MVVGLRWSAVAISSVAMPEATDCSTSTSRGPSSSRIERFPDNRSAAISPATSALPALPFNKILLAVYLMCSSEEGFGAHQPHRILGVTYKSAWFLAHRIREAMRDGSLAPTGGAGGIVEVDETFIGDDRDLKPKSEKKGRGYHHKHKVLSLVDRNTGQKWPTVVDDLSAKTLLPILRRNITEETRVMTNEAGQYRKLGAEFIGGHGFTRHRQGEYEDPMIHTNTIKGAFPVFKRGMKGRAPELRQAAPTPLPRRV